MDKKQGSKFNEGIKGVSCLRGEEVFLGQARQNEVTKRTPKSMSWQSSENHRATVAVQRDINNNNNASEWRHVGHLPGVQKCSFESQGSRYGLWQTSNFL
jgi:hypothetical protein